ncbi:MAG TPA: L-histidine N(alpha)-methyltransferase [Wenzhouxiangella sp.]
MNDFETDVIEGLSHSPKFLPCKYLYDEKGSDLFEQICETQDYYVTRADLELHETQLPEISKLIGADAHVIEFGSGAGTKTQQLLASLPSPRAYTPIEISPTALALSVEALHGVFPELDIIPLEADYTQDIDSEDLSLNPPATRRVVYFPGSTIGNFTRAEALGFLKRMGKIAQENGAVLVGVDLIKPIDQLLRAYDDDEGITAAFNKNLLSRLKQELDAEVDLDAFKHEARFNTDLNRIEMHLVATKPTTIVVANQRFDFALGESIHTESSHKYTIESFQALAQEAGLEAREVWLDQAARFSMHYLVPKG